MRYRRRDQNGDYVFGRGPSEFLVDSPAAVAQAVQTTLGLFQGEWFLDNTIGVPWLSQVIGYDTQSLYDQVIQNAILNITLLGVQLVTSFASYSSAFDTATRGLVVTMRLNSVYGTTDEIVVPVTLTGDGS